MLFSVSAQKAYPLPIESRLPFANFRLVHCQFNTEGITLLQFIKRSQAINHKLSRWKIRIVFFWVMTPCCSLATLETDSCPEDGGSIILWNGIIHAPDCRVWYTQETLHTRTRRLHVTIVMISTTPPPPEDKARGSKHVPVTVTMTTPTRTRVSYTLLIRLLICALFNNFLILKSIYKRMRWLILSCM
jgi:hypothetical protein